MCHPVLWGPQFTSRFGGLPPPSLLGRFRVRKRRTLLQHRSRPQSLQLQWFSRMRSRQCIRALRLPDERRLRGPDDLCSARRGALQRGLRRYQSVMPGSDDRQDSGCSRQSEPRFFGRRISRWRPWAMRSQDRPADRRAELFVTRPPRLWWSPDCNRPLRLGECGPPEGHASDGDSAGAAASVRPGDCRRVGVPHAQGPCTMAA